MTALLTIIIVLFVAVAIWQLIKIFDLAQVGASNTQIATDKDNNLNGYLMMGFLAFIYIITIVCFWYLGDLPLMSNSASEHGPGIDNLMAVSMIIIFIVQIVTQFLLHYYGVEACKGCNRASEIESGWYCSACPEPSTKWKNGNCNLATHVSTVAATTKQKINPLKASKRGSR